jgi:uncharacterized protein (DUF1778 family)
MPRPRSLPMPQELGNRSSHLTLRITDTERALMAAAMQHVGMKSQSDFVRHAIARLAEEYLRGQGATERVAAIEEEQAALYASEPPAFAPSSERPASLSDVLGVPLFGPPAGGSVASHGSSRVEAVGLDEPMDGWL